MQVRAVGWEMVQSLRHLVLTEDEAERLMDRLAYIDSFVKQPQAADETPSIVMQPGQE